MALLITWEDVKNTAIDEATNLESFTSSQRSLVLNRAQLSVNEATFGVCTFDAQRLFAAHVATMSFGKSAGEGTTGSETIGGVTVTKTLPVNNPRADQSYLSTAYGREYSMIRDSVTLSLSNVLI